MPKLISQSGLPSLMEFEFDGDVILGRGEGADISIPNATISRSHARISHGPAGYVITDLQSGNGTVVSGKPIKDSERLRDGVEIQLGGVVFNFHLEDEASSRSAESTSLHLVASEPTASHVLRTIQANEDPVESMLPDGDNLQLILAMNRRLQLISEIGKVTSQTLDEDSLLSLILEKLFEVFRQAEHGFVMRYDAAADKLVPKIARTRTGSSPNVPVSESLILQVVREQQGVLSSDAAQDDRFANSESVHDYQMRSVVCVPMVAHGAVFGVIQLSTTDRERDFEETDMALLLGIAGQAALSLSNAALHHQLVAQQLLQRDMALATKIQQSFLPQQPPRIPGYEFEDRYISALDIGGDYFDYLELPDGHLGIAVGDVSGKGVSAALYMAKLSAEVRFHAAGQTEPGLVLGRLNDALASSSESGMFVTLIFLSLDIGSGKLKVASAGHPPPLVRRANGQIVKLESAKNVPLGISADTRFRQEAIQLEPGASVLVFTDGVTEATNASDEEYGQARLGRTLQHSQGSPAAILRSLLDALAEFQGSSDQADDITVVCFGPTG